VENFQVGTSVSRSGVWEINVSWDITLFRIVNCYRRSEGSKCLLLQGEAFCDPLTLKKKTVRSF
jgi:hypothetical protein